MHQLFYQNKVLIPLFLCKEDIKISLCSRAMCPKFYMTQGLYFKEINVWFQEEDAAYRSVDQVLEYPLSQKHHRYLLENTDEKILLRFSADGSNLAKKTMPTHDQLKCNILRTAYTMKTARIPYLVSARIFKTGKNMAGCCKIGVPTYSKKGLWKIRKKIQYFELKAG